MRAVVVGSGLGGLGTALRLRGLGAEVTVLEQRATAGGRASQIRDGGFTWDTGPSLITMPWVLEETFAAGGLDLHRELTLHRLDPLYEIQWAGEPRRFAFTDSIERLTEQVARFSAADARRVPEFLAALKPIYEDGILDAGQRPFDDPRAFARLVPTMVRLGALLPLHAFVSRFFTHPRVREAFSFHSLFIGGSPFRVPAIYGALVYLQILDGGWYSDGGVYALVEALARTLDVRTGARVERIEHRAGRVTAVRLAGGERIPADVVVLGGDVLRTAELLGRADAPAVRRPVPTMSCLLLYLGTDRVFPQLRHHTLLVGDGYRRFIRGVTGGRRGRGLPPTFSTYVHAPARTEAAMAPAGGDSLAVLLPVPNLRGATDWSRETGRVRDALVADLERTFGLDGLGESVVVEHRMTPLDFAREFGAVDGNAFSVEPTLHQSAYFRPPNRVRGITGLYRAGAGTHPGAGIPGVLLGAKVTAGLIAADRGLHRSRRAGPAGPDGPPAAPVAGASLAEARATTRRVARTFALACRLLPAAVRDDVYLLYLVFRTLDDLVDEQVPEARARVDAVCAWAEGRAGAPTPEVATLAELARRHPLPRDAMREFCAGMRQDLDRDRFPTEADVDRYCYRVAGTVGLTMAAVLGADDPAAAAPAAVALGIAMQRTNILRDIDDDAAHGRVYLSEETIARHGDPLPGRRRALLREQIAIADAHYERGLAGVGRLRTGRRAVAAAGAMYREILRQIEREGLGEAAGRTVVPGPVKWRVGARAAIAG